MSGGTKQNGQTNPRSARSSKIKTLAWRYLPAISMLRSEEHTSELQSRLHLVCRLLLEKKKHSYILVLCRRTLSRCNPNSRSRRSAYALSHSLCDCSASQAFTVRRSLRGHT